MWLSWICCVLVEGTSKDNVTLLLISAFNRVNAILFMPIARACSTALTQFSEFPLVVKTIKTWMAILK